MNAQTLYWEDIDFSLLIPGMITAGPAQVSMAEYLTVFAETVKFRLEFFDGFTGFNESLVFETGIIRRARLETGRGDFRKIYKDLVRLASSFASDSFYSVDVLTDVLNSDDYRLPALIDDEFAEFVDVDQDTVDILIKVQNGDAPHYEIFTAKMLRLLYQILSLYTISKKDVKINRLRNRNTIIAIEPDSLTRDVRETWRGGGSSDREAGDSLSNANSNAYSKYSSNNPFPSGFEKSQGTNNNSPNFNGDNQLSFQSVGKSFRDDISDGYSAGYQSVEGNSLVWSYKNKDDVFVDVRFTMNGVLESNHRFIVDNTGNNEPIKKLGKFINSLPLVANRLFGAFVGGDDVPVDIDLTSFKSDAQEKPDGFQTTFSLSGDLPVTPMSKDSNLETGGFDEFGNRGELHVTAPGFVYADANSEGFDYFMEPDLFPPII